MIKSREKKNYYLFTIIEIKNFSLLTCFYQPFLTSYRLCLNLNIFGYDHTSFTPSYFF